MYQDSGDMRLWAIRPFSTPEEAATAVDAALAAIVGGPTGIGRLPYGLVSLLREAAIEKLSAVEVYVSYDYPVKVDD